MSSWTTESRNDSTTKRTSSSSSWTTNQDDDDDDELNEAILAISFEKEKVAAAYYTPHDAVIHIMPDTYDWPPFYNTTISVMQQAQAKKIISANKQQDHIVFKIRKHLAEIKADANCFELLQPKNYSLDACKTRLESLKLESEPRNANDHERKEYLHSVIDFSAEVMIRALGSLVMYIDKTWGNMFNTSRPIYRSVNVISLKNLVYMDDQAYRGLDIFNTSAHPANFKKNSTRLNRGCLFAFFNRCQTNLGRKKLRDIFMHPTNDLATIEERWRIIDFFHNNENTITAIESSLRNVRRVHTTLKHIQGSTVKRDVWSCLHKMVKSCVLIGDILKDHTHICDLFAKIVEMSDDVRSIVIGIDLLIDFSDDRVVHIKRGTDGDLDFKKNLYDKLPAVLNEVQMQETIPCYVSDYNLGYMPDLGFFLIVHKWKEELHDSEKQIAGFKLIYEENNILHYKTPVCAMMDDEIGDILRNINHNEVQIFLRMSDLIKSKTEVIYELVNRVSEVDSVLSMAKVIREMRYVRPTINSENRIEIRHGWHPLLHSMIENFVANDYTSAVDEGTIKIITGCNASGKSAYLKQVALIVYMAHIGSYVPAHSASVCLLEAIHSRIKNAESVTCEMSAFMIDLSQMAKALLTKNRKSLIIIDEFGTGTTELDGLGILGASINHFTRTTSGQFHMLISTNYERLSTVLIDSSLIRYQKTSHTFDADNNLVYEYKIVDGQLTEQPMLVLMERESMSANVRKRSNELLMTFKTRNCALPRAVTRKTNALAKNVEEFFKYFAVIDVDAVHDDDVVTFCKLLG